MRNPLRGFASAKFHNPILLLPYHNHSNLGNSKTQPLDNSNLLDRILGELNFNKKEPNADSEV